MLQIVKSITTLAAISTAISLIVSSEHFHFWKSFAACTVVQVILYQIYIKIVELFSEKLLNDRIVEYSKQGVEVACPCARAIKHFIPIQLNTNNSYKCLDCTKNISVEVDVKTFLETVPMDLEKTNAAFEVVYDKATTQTINGTNV